MKKRTLLILLALFYGIIAYSTDYYWVGGSGDWSDISHWATTSGGSTFHNQVPTSDDNVFFDANSFDAPGQSVNVNTDIAFCRDMSWAGANNDPEIIGTTSSTFNIHGSLRLINNMRFNFAGSLKLLSEEAGQTINLAGHSLQSNLTFQGSGGEWTLRSDIEVANTIDFRNGALITNDKNVEAGYLALRPINSGVIALGNSVITLTGEGTGSGAPLFFQTGNLDLKTENSTIILSAEKAGLVARGANANVIFNKVVFSSASGRSVIECIDNTKLNFDSLQVGNSATFLGEMEMNFFELTAGKGYTFQSSFTYTAGILKATGLCEAPIQMFASESGEAAIFQVASGAVQVDYASIKDIHATGGATFTADNSADLGNTEGWTINSSGQNDLYWVGGTGNWDDPIHWSFSSGGLGGACVPTGADNVFFDANSFTGIGDTVYINVDNALCKNMDWTGAGGRPFLTGNIENNIRIYASLTFAEEMEILFKGTIRFESSEMGNTVTTGNNLLPKYVYFNGAGGGWTLLDSLQTGEDIHFITGNLNTNDQILVFEEFIAEYENPRTLAFGNSHLYLRKANGDSDNEWPSFRLSNTNLTFDAGTSTIEFLIYGWMTSVGMGRIEYNNVIFDGFGSMNAWNETDEYIDSLTFRDGGEMYNDKEIGTLLLEPGYEYRLEYDRTFTIGELVADGDCNRLIYIHSNETSGSTKIRSDNILNGNYLILKDVHNTGNNAFVADNSIDVDNNRNIQINPLASRTLFWVGDAGEWSDPEHWSLTSGGPGGECIPTPIDDVIFDENSFSMPDQLVHDSKFPQHYCRDITWRNISTTPRLDLLDLLVFGSMELAEDMTIGLYGLRFSGNGNHTIDTKGHLVQYTNFEGLGTYTLLHDYLGHHLNLSAGTWNTAGYMVELSNFHSFGSKAPKRLELGNTYMKLTGSRSDTGNHPWEVGSNLVVVPGTSLIQFTAPGAWMSNRSDQPWTLEFHNIFFSSKEGVSNLFSRDGTKLNINSLEFNNDGIIRGEHTLDTLLFSPGKSYQLSHNETQTIKEYWRTIGNNCIPIQLSSTNPGTQANVSMPGSARVDGDFIQMRDQNAIGGLEFYAGVHSTDVGNNTGWIFDSAEDFVEVGFLGEDVVLCRNQMLTLSADNKSPGETYRWDNGSTDVEFEVNAPGVYWAQVTFANNCTIRDSIQIIPPEDFVPQLGPDTTLCTDETLLLDSGLRALGLKYTWQDGSAEPTFFVSEPGEYKIEFELSGCTSRDSILVDYTETPSVDLGADQTLCFGDQTTLDGTTEDVDYSWQDASAGATFTVSTAGIYWLDVSRGRCTYRDSVQVDYLPEILLDLGPDLSLCEEETFTLDATQTGGTYSWQDAITTDPTFLVTKDGEYWVDVTVNGCTVRDSVQANYKPLPVFDLGPDQEPCEEEIVTLDGSSPGATFLWSDNSINPTLQLNSDGIYWLDATLNGCTRRDSVMIVYKPLPIVDLGADQELCEGESYTLDATNDGATYVWQDGATTSLFTATTTGSYSVDVDLNGCIRSDDVLLTFKPLPVFDLGYRIRNPVRGRRLPWMVVLPALRFCGVITVSILLYS